MKTKNKILALLEIAIVLGLLFLVAMPAIAAEEDDFVLDVYGNANEDDTIDMRDLTYVKLIFFGKKPETELADAKYDGKINPLDFIQIKLIIVGKEKELTFIDCDGETVKTVHKPIERIVVAYYSVAEIIRMVGAENRVVGIDDSIVEYHTFFPDLIEKPCVGNRKDLDVEKILELEADVVILGSRHSPNLEDKLKDTGVGVIRLMSYNLVDVLAETKKLGYILDEEEKVHEYIIWHNEHLDKIKEKVSEIPEDEKPTVYIIETYYKEPGKTYCRGSAPDISVERAGGKSITHDIFAPDFASSCIIEVEIEWVLKQNPDVIIGSECHKAYESDDVSEIKARYEAILGVPGFDHIKAVEDSRVYMIKSMIFWGPAYPTGVTYIAKWLYPDLFEDLDPQAVHQEYIDRFHQGIDFDVSEHGVFVYHPEKYPGGR